MRTTFQPHNPAPILEALQSTTLCISTTTDAISQKFQTTGAWAQPPRRTWWIGHTLGILVNGTIYGTLRCYSPDSLQPLALFSAVFLPFLFIYLLIVIIIFKGVRIWVKCTEAPVRRAPALSSAWFLIHLFVVVYACLLQSHDCVSMATRVWVIICVTTFIPLRKGEGEVRLSL